ALQRTAREIYFFFGGEQRRETDLAEVHAGGVERLFGEWTAAVVEAFVIERFFAGFTDDKHIVGFIDDVVIELAVGERNSVGEVLRPGDVLLAADLGLPLGRILEILRRAGRAFSVHAPTLPAVTRSVRVA